MPDLSYFSEMQARAGMLQLFHDHFIQNRFQ
jgi:hypothetical protein